MSVCGLLDQSQVVDSRPRVAFSVNSPCGPLVLHRDHSRRRHQGTATVRDCRGAASGMEDRPTRLFVKPLRGQWDGTSGVDDGIDDFTVTVYERPCYPNRI